MPSSRGITQLADVADRERGDGFPQLVVRRKHSVVAMAVLPRRRDEIGEPVEELKRSEFDDAIGPRPRGLSRTTRADPAGRLVSGEHVADFGYAAVCTADHGEPLQGEGRPGTVSEKMFEAPKIARHIAIDQRDPDARVDGKPAVLPGEHVGGGRGVEQASNLSCWASRFARRAWRPRRQAFRCGRATRMGDELAEVPDLNLDERKKPPQPLLFGTGRAVG